MKLSQLVGSGKKIGRITLPVLIVGLIFNIIYPSFFSIGALSTVLVIISIIVLLMGIIMWAWSVFLIATKASKGMLITNGPFSLVKHPLYTAVALLVLPWVGFLCNTWLLILVGLIMYTCRRIYAPEEEEVMSKTFGTAWDDYCKQVRMPWL